MCVFLSLIKSDTSSSVWFFSEIKIIGSKGFRTVKGNTLFDHRSLEKRREQEQGTMMSVKGKHLAGMKGTYGSAPGCTTGDTAGIYLVFPTDSLQGTKIEGEICEKVSQKFFCQIFFIGVWHASLWYRCWHFNIFSSCKISVLQILL